MTREEAIQFGEMWLDVQSDSKDSITYKFFEMAIQALEQEPCEDAISRGQAIDAISKLYLDGDRPLSYRVDGNTEDILIGKFQAIYAINDLPPITQTRKVGNWIEDKGRDKRDRFHHCSECGRTINLICGATLKDYPYCHCGAKMEVSEDE